MSVQYAQKIDFNNIQKDADEISRPSYKDYSEPNLIDFWRLKSTRLLQIKDISNSDNKSDSKSSERMTYCLQKEKNIEKDTKCSTSKPNSKLKNRSTFDFSREHPCHG